MQKLGMVAAAVLLVGTGLFFSGVLTPKETPTLRLHAVLAETGEDVTNQVDWFVRWDGSYMGPDFAIVTEAAPGAYTAHFQVLGGDEIVASLTLDENEGGTLLANLDATLIEVALPAENRPSKASFRFEAPQSGGSQGVFVSEDGYARALISRGTTKLELEVNSEFFDVNTDLATGAVTSLILENQEVRPGK